ncbi:cyclopropane-fatty-acyl-phospholipid synthase family protein [Plantactinospora sp. KBS50]|uniref:SAM-dependent methyltransferase n=1 Tax=Plantactinospora sp. KBS50 TaxID=2024580 RepID=UPI000BAABA90|nr:methyltransferase domain-containing protein [Plantactinospora sp. KBS50]ASW55818.1 SAM-dependent methyltransferase [Plantactinospora sp. KBS50]
MDLPRTFTIRERDHRIHNPIDEVKLATLGRALRLRPGMTLLDLACGTGELLCTWSREHGIRGTGVDISTVFVAAARDRAAELGVTDRVAFEHGDAAGYVVAPPVDVAACIGATWIGGGVAGTIELLAASLRPGGLLLVGEPFWRLDPPDRTTVEGCHVGSRDEFRDLPGLVELFGEVGWDLVEMVLADEDSWDRYAAAQWLTVRRWLDANPDDELADHFRAELATAPLRYVRYQRRYLGWGVFALMRRQDRADM